MFSWLISLFLGFFILLPMNARAGESMPLHVLNVRFDLERNTLTGTSEITVPGGQSGSLHLYDLQILSASRNGVPVDVDSEAGIFNFQAADAEEILKIEFEAYFPPLHDVHAKGLPGPAGNNHISGDGISLTSHWYPSLSGLNMFRLTAMLPKGFEGLSEAEEILIRENPDYTREVSFLFPHPADHISLVAGKYTVERDSYNGKEIYAYFFPDDSGLAKRYIEHSKKYLEMYEKMLGEYPYKRFSIVENILPTGYSMPTFTLLGRDVVKLPFIVETSLSHEILHQWFGNMVYIDYSGGNWAEGLTTYLADHHLEEMKGQGGEYRKQLLVKFQSYVTEENDFPLRSFREKTDRASEAIGYGKSAMVFHMLKTLMGEDPFFRAIRTFIQENRFSSASWDDIKAACESAAGSDLEWFFTQWLDKKGAPHIELRNIVLQYRGSHAVVSFDVLQKADKFKIFLPVSMKSREGELNVLREIGKEKTELELETNASPLELLLDKDYDTFRVLSEGEVSPVISRLLGADKKRYVIPFAGGEEYAAASDFLQGEGFTKREDGTLSYDDLSDSSVLIIGTENRSAAMLFGKVEKAGADFTLTIRENPFNKNGVIGLADISAPLSELTGYLRKMQHYGKYSVISFENGRNTGKDVSESESGIRGVIAKEVFGIELPRSVNVPEMIGKVREKKIVYVGEAHDRFEHHRIQLEVIRGLYERNKKLAIGMEMFQKPFQEALDRYIAGEIDEKEFLKKSEYFERWGFDYQLYREILLFAREFAIPVLALNVRKEIVSKVSKEGLHSLTGEEMKEVPQDMDFSNTAYKKRLRDFFEMHKKSGERNFDFFYQAQLLWDESMAHNLDEFIRVNPEHQVVVIAGAGHLVFGYGIPQRAHRLNGHDYAIILNTDEIAENIADFVLFPEQLEYPKSPKLMVMLRKQEGKVAISGFSPGSISEKAGLKKDDVILSLDDTEIRDIDDIKIFLLYKKKGDVVTVKVQRQRFLFGPAVKTFAVTL